MSNVIIEEGECFYCNDKFNLTYHEVFNYPSDKDAYDIATTYKEMIWECPNCKKKGFLDHNVLYNDLDKHFTILYSSNITDIKEFIELQNTIKPDQTARVCDNYRDFVEKVMIFSLGLNDLVIEYCKINLAKQLAYKNITNIIFYNDLKYGPVLKVKTNDGVDNYAFDKQVYDIFYKKLTDLNLLNRKDDYIVNRDLAFNINKGINEPLYKRKYNI